MTQSPTQPKAHPFFDKHTVICTILLIIWAYFLVMIPAAIGTGIVCAVLRLGELQNYLFIGVAAMALVTLLVHRIWFQPEFKGILFRGFAKTLKCSAAILVFWLLLCLPDFLKGNFPQTFNLNVISLAVTAGFSEEVIFRGLPLSYLKRQLRSEKHIPLIVIITGAIFGLTHVSNILFGASVSASLVQGVTTTCIGIFLGAVFMRGGNIFVPMLLHALHDMLVLSFSPADEVSVTLTENATPEDFIATLICVGLAAFGLFLVRKSKRAEICRMWSETWSQTAEMQPEAPAEPVSESNGGSL